MAVQRSLTFVLLVGLAISFSLRLYFEGTEEPPFDWNAIGSED